MAEDRHQDTDAHGHGAMRTIDTSIDVSDLAAMAEGRFGNLVKVVVDVGRSIMVVDADMHADEEAMLLEQGSRQEDLWGVNLYPEQFGTPDFIEFDSMINIRPRQGNRSRSVDDPQMRTVITSIVARLVDP